MSHWCRPGLLAALGAGAVTAPFAARAQAPGAAPGKIWRIGFLSSIARPADLGAHYYGGFLDGMRELGYVEGRNLVIEWRFAGYDSKRLQVLAGELVQLKPDAIVTAGGDSPLALQKATSTIPIVMSSSGDPVGTGLIKSLARPGGNITGLSNLSVELGPKRLEMLRAMAPKATRIAVLANTSSVAHVRALDSLRDAASKLGMTMVPVEVRTSDEFDGAFAQMRQQNVNGLLVLGNPLFNQQGRRIGELAVKLRLPTITVDRVYVEAGCLMSYGANLAESFRYAATYVDKIFKGRKPADLPVEQPTRFELVINGKTAKTLGLKIPQALLISAERVIE